MDKYHDHDRQEYCYICGKPIYNGAEIEEGICRKCGAEFDERAKKYEWGNYDPNTGRI